MRYPLIEIKNPVLKNGLHYMTSDYKSRNSSRKNHNGIDMIGKGYACDYIVAIDKGIVDKVGYNSSRGYYIEINHGTLTSVYFHLKKGTVVVSEGNEVVKGQTIGYMGNTGQSSGAHLHFGVYRGTYSNIVDPLPYLEGKSIVEDKPIVDNLVYTVKKGDNLSKIASKYNTTYQELAKYNNISNPNVISVGQKINIPTVNTKFNLTRLIQLYSKGDDVKELQKRLRELNYNIGKWGVDGIAGTDTINAVKRYQKNNGLVADGIVGQATASSLGWTYKGK